MLKRYNLKCDRCNSKQVFGGYVSDRKKNQDIKPDKNRPFFLCPNCIWKADERIPDDWNE